MILIVLVHRTGADTEPTHTTYQLQYTVARARAGQLKNLTRNLNDLVVAVATPADIQLYLPRFCAALQMQLDCEWPQPVT